MHTEMKIVSYKVTCKEHHNEVLGRYRNFVDALAHADGLAEDMMSPKITAVRVAVKLPARTDHLDWNDAAYSMWCE